MARSEIAGLPVRIVGDGPPVVFLHGALVDGRLWGGVVDRLPGYTRVIPDLPLGAHRQALPPDADRSPAGHAARVAAAIVALGRGPVTLVGNDSGGAIAQLVAADHGEHVAGLVLTNCDALEVFPPRAYIYLRWLARSRAAMAAMAGVMRAVPALTRLPNAYGGLADRFPDGWLADWVAPLADPEIREDVAAFFRAAEPAITLGAADRLAARPPGPIRLVWGERDPFFRVALAERLVARWPGARLVCVDSRCYVPLDAPEALAEQIAAFVDEIPS